MKTRPAPDAALHQRAFLYIEAVIAAAIVGILFVTFYTAISSGFCTMRVARENLRATQIMLNRLEGVRLYNWNQLVSSNWIPATFTEQYYPPGWSGGDGVTYHGTMTITNAPLSFGATYANEMRMVTVHLTWVSSSVQRSRQMSTYVARYGMQNYLFNN